MMSRLYKNFFVQEKQYGLSTKFNCPLVWSFTAVIPVNTERQQAYATAIFYKRNNPVFYFSWNVRARACVKDMFKY